METPARSVNFPNLDPFRFLAAMMVVVAHAYQGWSDWVGVPGFMSNGNYRELSTAGKYIESFIYNLSAGVDIFFLISGFLITYLLLKEKELGKISIKKFYVRRALRILPLYYLTIIIAPLLIYWLSPQFGQPNYWANIFYINNFHTIYTGKWEYPFAHYWSLAVEEQFYLIWPWIIAFASNRRLPAILFSIIIAGLIYRAYAFIYIPTPKLTIYLHTLSNIDVLSLGALFAYRHYHKPLNLNFSTGSRVLVYAASMVLLFTTDMFEQNTLIEVLFKKYVYLLLAAFWIGNYTFNSKAFFVFKKRNILHYFGKISYGIYVFHNMLFAIIFTKIIDPFGMPNMYFYLFILFSMTIVLSILSYEFFEKKFLKMKTRFEVIRTR